MTAPVVTRVSRAAVHALRGLIELHFREHGWSSAEYNEENTLDRFNLTTFLVAALDYVRELHPLLGPDGVAEAVPQARATGIHRPLLDAVLRIDLADISVDTCVDSLVNVMSLEIVDADFGRREARPRTYLCSPSGWPHILTSSVDWSDCSYGVVAEEGWLDDSTRRQQAFRAVYPEFYDEESFTEIQGETALRLASFLFAGPKDWRSADAHEMQARAFVEVFGDQSRLFANRTFDADEIENPFAHVETVGWTFDGYCSSGKLILLMVTDGARIVLLTALWDVSAE